MISPDHARLMARYNKWQNESLYGAADALSDEARRQDRGAFFGSIFDTFRHVLFADQLWMHRLAGLAKPDAPPVRGGVAIDNWRELRIARAAFDEVISDWARGITSDWLANDMTWFSISAAKEFTHPNWLLTTHFFNHQTHHRGQAHAMLTAAGAKPDDTDITLLPA